MNMEKSDISGISSKMLINYVAMREKVDAEAKTVHSLSSLLALLQHCGDDTIAVDPVALGHVNEMIGHGILNIREHLDDFIYGVRARSVLERLEADEIKREI